MSPRPKRKRNTKNNDSENEEFSLADVMAKLASIEENQNNKIDGIKSTLDEIREKQNKLQENYETLAKTSKDQSKNHKELVTKVDDNSADIDYINGDLENINFKLNSLMQDKLSLNLIINGVPKSENENIKSVMSNIFTTIGVELEEDSITALWHDRNDTPPIIVKLKNKTTKDSILKIRKSNNTNSQPIGKSLYAKDFGFDSDKQIFINEELTQQTRILLNTTKKILKEQANFKFIWASDGKVLAKKNEISKIIHIRNKWEVQQLVKNNKKMADNQNCIPTATGSKT